MESDVCGTIIGIETNKSKYRKFHEIIIILKNWSIIIDPEKFSAKDEQIREPFIVRIIRRIWLYSKNFGPNNLYVRLFKRFS